MLQCIFGSNSALTLRREWDGAGERFPQCGNILSIVWKKREKVFHSVEKW